MAIEQPNKRQRQYKIPSKTVLQLITHLLYLPLLPLRIVMFIILIIVDLLFLVFSLFLRHFLNLSEKNLKITFWDYFSREISWKKRGDFLRCLVSVMRSRFYKLLGYCTVSHWCWESKRNKDKIIKLINSSSKRNDTL